MSAIRAPLSGSPLRTAARPPPTAPLPLTPPPPTADVRSALVDEIDAPTLVALQDLVLKDTYAAWADAKAAATAELAALIDAVSALERHKPASPPPQTAAESHHAAALAAAVSRRTTTPRTPPRGSSPFVRGRRGGHAAAAAVPMPRMEIDDNGGDEDDLPDALPATPFPLPSNASMRESIVRDPPPLPLPPPDSSSSSM